MQDNSFRGRLQHFFLSGDTNNISDVIGVKFIEDMAHVDLNRINGQSMLNSYIPARKAVVQIVQHLGFLYDKTFSQRMPFCFWKWEIILA